MGEMRLNELGKDYKEKNLISKQSTKAGYSDLVQG